MRRKFITVFVVLLMVSTTSGALAQTNIPKSFLNNDLVSVGVLLQTETEMHWKPGTSGENTFRIPRSFLKAYGQLDDNFSYVLQLNVTKSRPIHDAYIKYVNGDYAIRTGVQKPALSSEYLRSNSRLNFIKRSRIVRTLAQRRDVGFTTKVPLFPSTSLTAGIYNGNIDQLSNGSNSFFYTGRIESSPDIGFKNLLKVGVNVGYSRESGTFIGKGFLPPIDGKRFIYGGDLRLELNRLFFSSEMLLAKLEYAGFNSEDKVSGFHLTGGFNATDSTQVLLRYDHINSQIISIPENDLLIGGINYKATTYIQLQFNYLLNPNKISVDNQSWIGQIQLAL